MYAYPISTHKTEQIEPLNPTNCHFLANTEGRETH